MPNSVPCYVTPSGSSQGKIQGMGRKRTGFEGPRKRRTAACWERHLAGRSLGSFGERQGEQG